MKALRFTLFSAIVALLASGNCRAQVPTDSIVADFRDFISKLEQIHPDPYSGYGGKPYFRLAARDTRHALINDQVTDVREFAYRINEFLAPLKDGHTVAMPDGHFVPGHFPVKYTDPATLIMLEPINDGIIVKALPDEYKGLEGSRLVAIEGMPVKDVWTAMAHYFIAENQSGQMLNLAHYAMQPKALKKVIPSINGTSITYQLLSPSGQEAQVTLPVVPFAQVQQWQAQQAARPSAFPGRQMNYNFLDQLVYGFVDDECKTMYFGAKHMIARDLLENTNDVDSWLQGIYSAVGMPVPPDRQMAIAMVPSLSEEFEKALQLMKQHGSKNLVIDMRGNGGGTTPICRPLVYMLYGDKYLNFHFSDEEEGVMEIAPWTVSQSNLDQINAKSHDKLEYGDFFKYSEFTRSFASDKEMRSEFIDGSMCSIKDKLRALNGAPVYQPEHVYVVTDALTFSAAFHFSYYLWRMGATVVGVTSSQAPNTFMGGQAYFTLPRTGLVGEIDRGTQQFFPDDDPRAKMFTPDLAPTYEDYKRYNFDDNAILLYLMDVINGNIKSNN